MNDWAGFLSGHTGMKIHTPNIDRLAASSMIFTNAHTPAPACAPTRAAILTGVDHARSGAENVHWGDGPKWREFDALKDVLTLEQFFKKNGYTTLGAGKIYHSQAPPWSPTSQVEPANWELNALEKSANADNTIVVLWSVHGRHMGEKDNLLKNSPFGNGLRGYLC
jgi:choline-sulfatase